MHNDTVVITGIGMVTPLGLTAKESLRAWTSGEKARVETVTALSLTEFRNSRAAVLPEFNPAEKLKDSRMVKYMSDAAMIGCLAAKEAMQDAHAKARFKPERIGLFAGSGLAAAQVDEAVQMVESSIDGNGKFSCRLFGKQGLASCNPLLSFKILANIPPCLVSIIEKIKGYNSIFGPWEGHTFAAIEEAVNCIRSGEVDCALTGAADYPSYPATIAYLKCAGLLSDDEYPAPAAAYLFLERNETAVRDRQHIYGSISSIEAQELSNLVEDPIAVRLGRTFAAAPPVAIGLSLMTSTNNISLCGVDRRRFTAKLEY
jgi:3-oxoacyl-[acyl-carrier-protein] synthase II